MAGFDVLTTLRRAGSPFRRTSGQLADSGLISSAGITPRMDRLEKDGLIARERDPDDRRVVYARLTEEVLAKADALFAEHLANEQRMLAALSPVERRGARAVAGEAGEVDVRRGRDWRRRVILPAAVRCGLLFGARPRSSGCFDSKILYQLAIVAL